MLGKLYRRAAGELAIATVKTSYFAGDRVVGKVYLRVKSKKKIDVSDLRLRIVGEELVQVFVNRKTSNKRDHKASRDFFSLDVSLDLCSHSEVDFGVYEFPFEACLPDHLPSSMVYSDKASKCEIRYLIMASLSQTKYHRGAKSTGELQINGLLSSGGLSNSRAIAQKDSSKSKRLSRDRGSITIESIVDQPVVSRGGKVKVGISYCNDSSAEIDGFRFQLLECVRWKASGHEKLAYKALQEKFIRGSNLDESGKIELGVPADSRCTYEGDLIEVSHELVVTMEHQSWTLGTPRVRTKIQVQPEENMSRRRRLKEGATSVRQLKLLSLKSNFTSARTA